MADQPQYGQLRVTENPLPNVRVTSDAPSAAFGVPHQAVDLSGLADEVHRYSLEEKRKADNAALVEADNQASDARNDELLNPDTGILSQKGKNAIPAVIAGTQHYQQTLERIRDGLANDQQKEAFSRLAVGHMAQLRDAATKHEFSEVQQYNAEQSHAAIGNAITDAARNFDNPSEIGFAAEKVRALVNDGASQRGVSPDVRQAEMADAVTRLHANVLDNMLANNQDMSARNYFDAHRDEIVGPAQVAIAKAVKEGSYRGESQRQADAILSQGGTLTDMVAKARAISDPTVRDLVEDRIRHDDAEQKTAAREQREQLTQAATNTIEQTHDFGRINPTVVAQLSISERKALRSYAEELAGGGAPQTDIRRWLTLRSLAANPETRPLFMQWNPVDDINRMSPADLKSMVEFRDGLRAKDDKTAETLDNLNYRHGIVTNSLRGIGMLVDPKSGMVEKPEAATLYRSVDSQIEQLQEREGRKATSKEVQQITDDLLTSHVVADPHWYNPSGTTTKRLFQLDPVKNPEQALVLTPRDIPADARAAMTRQLRAAGLPVTDESLVSHYKAYLGTLVSHGPR